MPGAWRTVLVVGATGLLAGALGVAIGLAAFNAPRDRGSLDDVVHRELGLSADQDRAIAAMEVRFASRRAALEDEMRAATRDIAAAVSADQAYSPRVEAAVNRFHEAMGELQRETILHVFEMRAVLTADQQERFDEIVRVELLGAAEDAGR